MSTSLPRPGMAAPLLRAVYFAWALSIFSGFAAPMPAATLLKYNFEGTNTWSGMAGYFQSDGGSGSATPTVTTVGTVNTYGTTSNTYTDNVASNGIKLLVNSQNATGNWTAGVDSGVLGLLTPNTITNTGLLTLSFSLWSTKANPILVRVESYDATSNLRTGGLKTLIYPAAPNYYQRFALDLSTMTPDGAGTFVPASNSKFRIYFEISNTVGGDGWPNASANEIHVDNINYSSPRYFVKPSSPGSDSNNGTTETTPWKTISKAVTAAVAGDIIVLMGSETDQFVASGTSGQASFTTQRGTPEAWIVLKNYPGQTPILVSAGWNTIAIGNGSSGAHFTGSNVPAYIEIRGLTVRGYSSVDSNGDRQLAAAYKPYVGLVDSRSNTNGIGIDGRNSNYVMHDLRIANNIVEYCSASGIGAGMVDRVAIENNISRYNTWWSIYGGSGISLGIAVATENNTDQRMLVQGNQSYGNEGMIPWRAVNGFSDGNGIIVDTNQISKSGNNPFNFPDYTGRTLVQNNLCYNNGGSGIHAFQSAHVDIVHNVAYHNSASPRLLYGEIFAGYASDVRMLNNILVAPGNPTGSSSFNEPITSSNYNTAGTIYYQNNVFYGEGNNQALPTNSNFINNTTTNPLFLSPGIDPNTNDFHLRSTSPALNNGLTISYRSALDFALRPRLTTNLTPDRGAYQTQSTDVYAPVFTPQSGNYTTAQSVTLTSDTPGAKIIYTTNGTTPAVDASGNPTTGSVYTSPFSLNNASTPKAIAWKSGLNTSYVANAYYTFNTTVAAIPTPTFDVWPLTTDGTQFVSVICNTPGAIVRYTLDGSTPTETSGTLAGANAIPVTAGNLIQAIAYKSGRADSAVLTGNYVVRPYLGSVNAGTATDALGLNKIRFARFHPVSDLTVTKIYAKVGAIAGSYRAAIYADSGGAPAALLKASSGAVTNPAAGWQAFSLTGALALPDTDSSGNALYYWLAIWSNDAAATVYTTTTGGTLREATSTFGATWPTTAPTSTASANAADNYSIFATTNYQPVVSAGSGQTLASVSSTATLTGVAYDNSTPAVLLPAGFLTTTWSKVSGPGTVTFANGAALATTATFSQTGTYVLRLTGQDIVFTPFAPVTSEVTITVSTPSAGAATTTALASSNATLATLGSAVTFTSTVTAATGTPAGTVTFFDGGTSLGTGTLNASGTATLATSTLSVGIHSITAVYGGNATYATSTSNALSQTIILLDGTTRLIAINAAGPAISGSGFGADAGFTGGLTTSVTAPINLSAVTYPAPQAVYQAERYGTFSYTLTGFTPAAAYLVRLHFSENHWGVGTHTATVGQRRFNVFINGTQRLFSFDIWATAGASNKAVIEEFDAAADQSGQLTINFAGTNSPDTNALVDGLEVYTVTSLNAWRVATFTPAQLDDPRISGLTADPDGDGVSNLLEYALGMDPLTAGTDGLPVAAMDADGHLTLTFMRARDDVTYMVEGSDDLMNWTAIATNPGFVEQSVTVTDNAPLSASPRFMRLRVTY